MSLLKIKAAVVFLLLSSWCFGQWHVVAVSSTGVLINNPGLFSASDNLNIDVPKGGTISTEEAKNIFAINAILVDAKKNLFLEKIEEFKMSVYDNTGEYAFHSNSEMLTAEMKEQLKKIQPGSKLYFEYVRGAMSDGTHPNLPTLGFVIE